MWEQSKGARTHVEIHEMDSGHQWLSVDGPGFGVHNWIRPHQNPLHCLLRPYDHAVTTGKPLVGHVQYHYLQLPDESFYRLHHALAVRQHETKTLDGLLPGTLMLFPGISPEAPIGRDGKQGLSHHVVVREGPGRKVKVYNHFREGAGGREVAERLVSETVVSENAHILHLGEMWVKDRSVLDEAGFAILKLPPGAIAARTARGELWPELPISRHPVVALRADEDMWQRPNYLWTGFFLMQNPPSEAETVELNRFFHHRMAHERATGEYKHLSKFEYDGEYGGDIHHVISGVDLHSVGVKSTYRYLVTMQAIVPGRMDMGMGLAMSGFEMDFLAPLRG